MFRASLCPSSGAYQLQQQPLLYRRNVVVAVLLVVVRPAGPTSIGSQRHRKKKIIRMFTYQINICPSVTEKCYFCKGGRVSLRASTEFEEISSHVYNREVDR
jgi:hypothetical protein